MVKDLNSTGACYKEDNRSQANCAAQKHPGPDAAKPIMPLGHERRARLGIWKTFNVMTLTALGSGPLAVGRAAWVFNRKKLQVIMRAALRFPVLMRPASLRSALT